MVCRMICNKLFLRNMAGLLSIGPYGITFIEIFKKCMIFI